MKGFGSGKLKKGWLLGGIAILLAAVVAVCFCCVRIETPQQRQQRLASQTGTGSVWSEELSESLTQPAGSQEDSSGAAAPATESGSSSSAGEETPQGQASSSGDVPGQTLASPGEAPQENPSVSSQQAASSAPSQPDSPQPDVPQTNTVTVSISCQTALNYAGDLGLSLPEDGMLLPATQWEFTGSATVWDAFQVVCNANGIEYRATSSWSGQYIRQIGGLRELACGSTSGWVYYLNGSFPSQGVSSQPIQDGDVIQIAYTVIPGDSVPS